MKNVIYIMYWVFRLLFFLAGFSASAEQGYQQAESRQTLVLGVYAREFPGGLLKLDPAFAYAEPPSS